MFINNIGKPKPERELIVGSVVVSGEDGRCYLIVDIDEHSSYYSEEPAYGLMNLEKSIIIAQYPTLVELKDEQIYPEDTILYPGEYKLTLDK